ncbi:MAG: SH3 domain-containing protein [Sphingomonadaceae bacterium]|nr:SH3 domain-containing protein [Sphingomonadaceae bacterium]
MPHTHFLPRIALAIPLAMVLAACSGSGEDSPPPAPDAQGGAGAALGAGSPATPDAIPTPAPAAQSAYDLLATVEDPDGYTNVRAGPSTDKAIVGRVAVGQTFSTYQQDGKWWRVKLADGSEGWIARSRIRLPGEVIGAARKPADSGQMGDSTAPDYFNNYAMINDPDGYTNVRAGKDSSAKVIGRINAGEKFLTYPQDGEWWEVVMPDGRRGYMHRSRISML